MVAMHFPEIENYMVSEEYTKCIYCEGTGRTVMLDDCMEKVSCPCYVCDGTGDKDD